MHCRGEAPSPVRADRVLPTTSAAVHPPAVHAEAGLIGEVGRKWIVLVGISIDYAVGVSSFFSAGRAVGC